MTDILEIPNAWQAGIITIKGLGLLSKLVKGNTLLITRAETGAGYVDPALLSQQTAVTDPMQALTFHPVSYPEEGKCVIPCKLTNASVTASYIARQVGLYAEDPDEGEILFYITQVKDANGGTGIPAANIIPSYSSTWNLTIYYGMADGVTVTVDPAGAVTHKELEEAIEIALQSLVNKLGSVLIRTITIPADGWVEMDEPAEGCAYSCDVAVEEVTAAHWPSGGVDRDSTEIACEAGMLAGCDTEEGALRFYAARIPAADMTATLALVSEGWIVGGAGGSITVDTDLLGNGMAVTEDGRLTVAIGNGLIFDGEGKVAVDAADDGAVKEAIGSTSQG